MERTEAEGASTTNDESDELSKFFQSRRKKITTTSISEDVAISVEQFLGKLDATAEIDAELNRSSKPALQKLKMLPELLHVLEKRGLQQEFLDRGVLSSLKNWLEPLPDGSLPSLNIRAALLNLLKDLPINMENIDRREQFRKSGLGKVVMFLSRVSDETPVNRKLAQELVQKWSRPIFQKSTSYAHLREHHEERRPPPRQLSVKKPVEELRCVDQLELAMERAYDPEELERGKLGSYDSHVSRPRPPPRDFVTRPRALPLVFAVMPSSNNVDAENRQAHEKRQRMEEKRSSLNKKLKELQKPKKKTLQAVRLSVHGR